MAVVADFARAKFVLANSAELDIPQSWLPTLGALKAAGAAGLLLGLLGVPAIGLMAATGLVLYFAGAVIVHVWAHAYVKIAIPGLFLALAAAALALTLTH
ncbi:DoxX family protein [Nonomuraea sp. NPDC049784]|uniref:DoxX family protein n=1 Tax=Nonomuraea sp. NPDC049784 TaxID=3154361 RepID=UPI003403B368